MKYYRLPRQTLILWQARALSATFLLSVCLLILFKMWGGLIFAIATTILWVTAVIIVWIYLPLLWRSFKITVGEDAVEVRRGRIFINVHVLPFYKTVYSLSYQTPFARKIGFAGLILKGPRSRIFIPELPKKYVEDIRIAVLGEKSEI